MQFELIDYLEAHGADGVSDEDKALEVGLVRDPESGGMSVHAVSDDTIPNLEG